jgi:methyltransferase (TIGR00027 family)
MEVASWFLKRHLFYGISLKYQVSKPRVVKKELIMNENQPSLTSMVTAYMRAYHSMHATNKIFDDFLAYSLIPVDKRNLIEQHFAQDKQLNTHKNNESGSDSTNILPALTKTNIIICRARYTEDLLEKAISQGFRQYVILGAGLDTFAFRRPDLMEQLEVFEVDHPATQEFKLHRIAELGWKHPAKLHFIPINFTKENLESVLSRSSSYDPQVKSFFSWLGVTRYLTRDEVFATLRSITKISPSGSTIIFNYTDLNAFNPDKFPQLQRSHEFFHKIGEPVKTGFNPSTLAEELGSLGFHLEENLNPEDIERLYFKGKTDECDISKYGHIARAIVE